MEKVLSSGKSASDFFAELDKALMMCDDEEDVGAMACAMLTVAMKILESQFGADKAHQFMQSAVEDRYARRKSGDDA